MGKSLLQLWVGPNPEGDSVTLVKEWQQALAKIPSDWVVEMGDGGLFSAVSPDGEDRKRVEWAWHTQDNPVKPVIVVDLVKYPALSNKDKEFEFYKVELWEDDGRRVGDPGEWLVWQSGCAWRWSVFVDDGGAEVTGSCETRMDALGEAYKVRWERTMEKIKARARAKAEPAN